MKRIVRRIQRILSNRLLIVGLLIAIQALFLFALVFRLYRYNMWIEAAMKGISILILIFVINNNDDPAFKLAWGVAIALIPVFGGLLYLMVGGQKATKLTWHYVPRHVTEDADKLNEELDRSADIEDDEIRQQAHYIKGQSGYPVQGQTEVEYFPSGEATFERLWEELEKAEHYIFMEFFIVDDGQILDKALEILERKAKEGVDVRLIYDDIGTIRTLPAHYDEELKKRGIQCSIFNRFVPFISFRMNNRTHRKIVVIDGYTSFTGGINLADEYANLIDRFGHWKDSGLMLKGAATWNFTQMFLETWEFLNPGQDTHEPVYYKPDHYYELPESTTGYVSPYGCSPGSPASVSASIYCNVIDKAKRYVYITTPYLIPNNELIRSLIRAAQNGVDVRIITPCHWDKYVIHMLTQSHYRDLIDGGVKVYEYQPGFIHAKGFAADDEVAVVGSINLDYRSLYLHYECSVWMYHERIAREVREDFEETLTHCQQIDVDFCEKRPLHRKLIGWFLKLFAPLL